MKKTVGWALLGVLAVVVNLQTAIFVHAAINEQIPFYGTLQDTNEVNLSGTYDMVFRFYDASSGGTLLDTSTHTAANGNAVTVTNGEFGVLLGSGTGNALNGLDFNSATIYVGVTIGSDSEMTPRERLGSVAYSFNTDLIDGYDSLDLLRLSATNTISYSSTDPLLTVEQLGTGDILNVLDGGTEVFTILDGGNVGIGSTSPTSKLTVSGDMRVTGAYRDSSGDAGTSGQLLLATGSGTNWVATSSLGITASLSNNSVTPNHVLTTGQTDEYCLTYESTGTTWEWQTCGGGGSLFTDGGATTYLTSISDNLAIGSTSAPTKLSVAGNINLDGDYGLYFSNTPILLANTANNNIYFGDTAGTPGNTDAFDNIIIGRNAASSSVAAWFDGNVIIGNDTSGGGTPYFETTIGYQALMNGYNDLGVTLGYRAGYNSFSFENVMIGFEAGGVNTGNDNVLMGISTGLNNSGDYNVIMGYESGSVNSANYNFMSGYQAGQNNTGDNGVLLGYRAGRNNLGDNNVILGLNAGLSNLGASNILLGISAGASNVGTTSIIIGTSAGEFNSGEENIIFGLYAGVNNAGDDNTLIGSSAGGVNFGNLNNFIGWSAGDGNYGDLNNFIGYQAGQGNVGDYNNFIGYRAGRDDNSGNYNDFIGYTAGQYLNSTSTVAIGGGSLRGGSTLGNNVLNTTAIGYNAGFNVRTGGNNNIFVGYNAGDNITTGDNNIIIGYDIDHISAALSNRLNIGNLIFGTAIDGTGNTLSSGNVGIGTSTPLQKLQVRGDIRVGTTGSNGCIENFGGGVIGGTCSSDEQLKTNIVDLFSNEGVLERLVQLTPVSYNWNEVAASLYYKDVHESNIGLLAQDVEEQFPELVSLNKDEYRQVNFTALPFYLLGAIKELYEKVTGLEEKTREIDELRERIERLESESGVTQQQSQTETSASDTNEPESPEEIPVEPNSVTEDVVVEEVVEPEEVPTEDLQVTPEAL